MQFSLILKRLSEKRIILGAVIVVVLVIFLTSFGNEKEEIIKPNSISQTYKEKSLDGGIQEYDYTEAINHVGEKAVVSGEVVKVFTAKSGVTFLDFCEDYSDCPFTAVIFAGDAKKFSDISQYQRKVKITGTIKMYNGRAEIILKNPDQIQ